MKHPSLEKKTVVITGASSGIGKAAALAFAKEKARVVLASRRGSVLEEVAQECRDLGGEALAIEADVTDYHSVKNLMKEAVAKFGSIDVWINNAGVGALGEFDQTPLEIHEQVIKTNLLGPLYGCYAVLGYFKQNGKGTIINTNSTGSYIGAPFSVAYSAGKFGLKGLSEALRFEMKSFPKIHVCDIFASFVDSPGMQHAGNYIGKEVKPAPPLVNPEKVASTMVRLAKRPKSKVHLGSSDRLGRLTHGIMPEVVGFMMNQIEKFSFKKAKTVPKTSGNLLRPTHDHSEVHGGYAH